MGRTNCGLGAEATVSVCVRVRVHVSVQPALYLRKMGFVRENLAD